jgi:TonB-dependent receptor
MLIRRLRLLITALSLGFISIAQAQSIKLSGKVLNEKNEPLAGVTIKITSATGGTTTDGEGRFTLNLNPGKKYELVFTAIGYETKNISDVEVTSGQINELNIVLSIQAKTGDNVTVTATRSNRRLETALSLIAFQKNTNTVASVISAESIRRSPDKNTGEVLKRTPGASLQEGKFIVIRGLADRYNQAMLNGILLTSTEPDRKTFSFDLIPAPMIDNIVINKAFVPEYPGEWAGGLIQVNTKDIPAKGFLNIQVGIGVNSQTTGKKFFKDGQGGDLDWLGTDDGTRALPSSYTTKSEFDLLTPLEKTAIGKQLRNSWAPVNENAGLNFSFLANGGFVTKLFGKNFGGNFGVMYNRTNKYQKLLNRVSLIDDQANSIVSVVTNFDDDKYITEVSAGALGSLSLQLNPLNRISVKSIININSPNSVTKRVGPDNGRAEDIQGSEFMFKQNTFFSVQAYGDHSLNRVLKFKWYGSFNILDGYIPDQRRILYSRPVGTQNPHTLLLSNTLSQQSGSRIYQSLSDYIYTGGGDLTYNFNWLGQKQTLKGGYMFQVKDRLYDAQLFANYLPTDNSTIRSMPADQVFASENFGTGTDNKIAFDAIKGNTFRYLANTILNAGFIQFDNQFTPNLRVVWGLRVENYDQLIGSVKVWDQRHQHSEIRDYLPGVNATLKLNSKTNIRLSGSQTVVRPELRELASLNLYDFELNASVQGNPLLKRTKVSNFDLRYELYPRPGEVFTAGVFYKHFTNAIEQFFNGQVTSGSSTFTYLNADKATAFGAEVEMRKKLDFSDGLKNFTFQANVAYIKSKVTDRKSNLDRPLQGQSPYVLNFGLLYDLEKSGFNATLLFNQIGHRIYIVQDAVSASSPDIYEAPRPVFDIQLAKKLLKSKGEIKLNVADLLNKTQYFYQNVNDKLSFQKNTDAYRFTRRFGTTYSITFSYSL